MWNLHILNIDEIGEAGRRHSIFFTWDSMNNEIIQVSRACLNDVYVWTKKFFLNWTKDGNATLYDSVKTIG